MNFFLRRFILFIFNLAAIPPHWSYANEWRNRLLGLIGARIARGAQLSEHIYILNGTRLTVGTDARIGSFCRIWDFYDVTIGNNLLASHNVTIVAGTHRTRDLKAIPGPVTIGDNCWIGAGVTIVGPVTIGDDVIIGAGAVVLHDLPSATICVGAPARPVKTRSQYGLA